MERLGNHYVSSQYASNPFRASSAGTCARLLGYRKLYPEEGLDTEATVDVQFQSLLDLGNVIHDSERQLYKDLGYEVRDVESSVTTTYTMDDLSDITVRGKIDGIIDIRLDNGNTVPVLFDIKTTNGGNFKKIKSMGLPFEYKAQASVYTKGLDIQNMFFIFYNKDTSERMVMEYVDDPLMQENVRKRFNKVYDTHDEDSLPDREHLPYRKREKGKLTDTLVLDAKCQRCLFNNKCFPEFYSNDEGTHLIAILDEYDGDYITPKPKTRKSKPKEE